MTTLSPIALASLIADAYHNPEFPCTEKLSLAGVDAYIIDLNTERVGLILGSNSFSDWIKYNLLAMHVYGPGDQYLWHSGFLQHAQIAYSFFKNKGCTVITGHSLGAAAGGIVAVALNIPAILFATPQALYGTDGPPNANLITNFCREDDIITRLPFTIMGYCHCGTVQWLKPQGSHIGSEHGIIHYIELLQEEVLVKLE